MASESSESHPAEPVESREQSLARGLFGYACEPVDELLRETASVIASIKAEKLELAERITRLEADLAGRQEAERLLRSTLISTERAADQVRQRASAETDQLLADTHAEARRLVAAARAERARLDGQSVDRAALLRAARRILETEPDAAASDGDADTDTLDEVLREQVRRTLV